MEAILILGLWVIIRFPPLWPVLALWIPMSAMPTCFCYIILAILLNRTDLRIQNGNLTIYDRPLPWRAKRIIDLADIGYLTVGGKPILHRFWNLGDLRNQFAVDSYAISATLKDGREVKLLDDLKEAEALVYVEQLARWLDCEFISV
jgi:hypothetical protein